MTSFGLRYAAGHSDFVGIDLSRRQIDIGQKAIADLALPNIELRQLDIANCDLSLGQFDYIIAHGLFSWVPATIQQKIFDTCVNHLAPHGVAYVRYNTNPGWRMRGLIRDVMNYRARAFQDPVDRIRHARGILGFLAQAVSTRNDAYSSLLQSELKIIREKEDQYLLHEHLEEINEPIYFHEFAERAAKYGLQYLGEAEFGTMSLGNLPTHVENVLRNVAANRIELEQYMDFVCNRTFRESLLCHQNVHLDRGLSAAHVQRLYVASASRPENPAANILSDEPLKFVGPTSVMTTSDKLVKAAIRYLGQVWPQSIRFGELLEIAYSRLLGPPPGVDTPRREQDASSLAEVLMRCYSTTQVELSTVPSVFTLKSGKFPQASPNVRRQAHLSSVVTNCRHEPICLTDVQHQIIVMLDGKHSRQDLIEHLLNLVNRGVLLIHNEGSILRDQQQLNVYLTDLIDQQLTILARSALLLA